MKYNNIQIYTLPIKTYNSFEINSNISKDMYDVAGKNGGGAGMCGTCYESPCRCNENDYYENYEENSKWQHDHSDKEDNSGDNLTPPAESSYETSSKVINTRIRMLEQMISKNSNFVPVQLLKQKSMYKINQVQKYN